MVLYYVTGNSIKFREASQIIKGLEWLKLDLEEVQSLDSKEIIRKKLEQVFRYKKGKFIVEDVSFSLDCIGGLPGPLIKWFLKSIGTMGIFEIADRFKNYGAVSSIEVGYAESESDIHFFDASIKGLVIKPAKNSNSFWDDLFMPTGYTKTFAEMSLKEKNSISHRGLALAKLNQFLHDRKIQF